MAVDDDGSTNHQNGAVSTAAQFCLPQWHGMLVCEHAMALLAEVSQ